MCKQTRNWSRDKRFESARRLSKSAYLQVKRGRRSERWDASQLHVLQPVWPKGLSAWRLGASTTLTQRERTIRQSERAGYVADRLRLLARRSASAGPRIMAQAAPPPPMARRFFAPLDSRTLPYGCSRASRTGAIGLFPRKNLSTLRSTPDANPLPAPEVWV